MNCVWPSSPAQAPRMSPGERSPRSITFSALNSWSVNSSVRRQS
jgi:hypothetical protein